MSDRYKILLLLVVVSILYSLHLNQNLDTGGDNARYIILARSLIEGKGYKDIGLAGEPHHIKYPFVFPLLLAPLLHFFDYNVLILKLVPFIFALATIICVYLIMLDFGNNKTAMTVALLMGISTAFIKYSTVVLSEVPYTFFTLLAIIFFNRYHREEKWSSKNGFLFILFLFIVFFTRTVGMSLVAASLTFFILEGNYELRARIKKVCFIGIPSIIFVGLWFLRSFLLKEVSSPGYSTFFLADPFNADAGYVKFLDLPHRVIDNSITSIRALGAILVSRETFVAVGIVFLTIVIFEFMRRVLFDRSIIEYYLIFYFGILLLNAFKGTRFYIPILPFVFFYFVAGIGTFLKLIEKEILKRKTSLFLISLALMLTLPFLLIHRSSEEYYKNLVFGRYSVPYLVLLLIIFVLFLFSILLLSLRRLRKSVIEVIRSKRKIISLSLIGLVVVFNVVECSSPPYGVQYTGSFKEYYEMGQYIKENTPPDAIIMGLKPHLMHLWTGRKMSWVYPFTKDEQRIKEHIFDRGVDYVIFSPELVIGLDGRYLAPVIEKNITIFEEIYSVGKTKLFKIRVDPQ